MNRQQIESLLDRYLKGETTTTENTIVENWLEENRQPDSPWNDLAQQEKSSWLSGIYQDLEQSRQEIPVKIIPVIKKKTPYLQFIAAAAALIAVLFAIYLQSSDKYHTNQSIELTALTVPAEQTRQITLPDGSKVWVNAGSELKFPDTFSGQTREVYLSGEAYFDIAHNPKRPFLIHTGKITTTVLGTAFNIKEDKDQHLITVTVTRGKVGVAAGNRQLGIITPDHELSFNLLNEQVTRREVDALTSIAWQQRELQFEDVTFEQAVLQLEKRFHVKITFRNDQLKNCRFSGTEPSGAGLEQLLKVICAINHATYQTNEDGSIQIDGKGCN